jgi:hypothetical protein
MTEMMSQLIDFSLYDTHEHELGQIVGVVLGRLQREWTDLDQDESGNEVFHSPLQMMVSRRQTARKQRRKSSGTSNTVMPVSLANPHGHVLVDEEKSLMGSLKGKLASSFRNPSMYKNCLYDEDLRKRAIRVLDDWRIMISILLIVFTAVIAAFTVPQEMQEVGACCNSACCNSVCCNSACCNSACCNSACCNSACCNSPATCER